MTSNDNFNDDRESQLQLLLQKARSTNTAAARGLIVKQIVKLILSSRPLCYRFQGKLTGVYREIYEEIKQKMSWAIADDLNNSKQTFARLSRQQTRFFRASLDDLRLKELGLSAQRFPPNSELKSYGLDELVRAIKLSGKLCRPHINNFPRELYQVLYDEALTETLAYICLQIDRYDPERGNGKLMNWVNFHLNMNVLQCYRQLNSSRQYNLPSLQELAEIPQTENLPSYSDLIYQYILEDSQGLLRKTHIRDRPDANFRIIALAKLEGQTWQEIGEKLKISKATLSDFYNRWCERFAELFRQELN
jgi:hypothetical protein